MARFSGNGLLNVEKLFDYLKTYKSEAENRMRFAISVGNGNKGIHMRSGQLNKPEEFSVTVEPLMFNEKYAGNYLRTLLSLLVIISCLNKTSFSDPSEKINFNMRLALVASHPWIEVGKFIDLCYTPRSFCVKVNPTNLQPGVYRGRVRAYDTVSGSEKGTIFEVPITVVQPFIVNNLRYEFQPDPAVVMCKPNTIIRDFILVPTNATYAILEMMSADPKDQVGGKFLVHTMQIVDQRFCKYMETEKILPVNGESVTCHPFKCTGDNVLEVCIAKYWSNFGEVPLQYKVKFHGFKTNNAHIMHSANGIHRIDVTSLLPEEAQPSISLKHSVMVLKPTESKITALTKRDVIPNQRQIFQNVLTYNLHLIKTQELSLHAPLFSSVLYESEFESQFWMLFDANKSLIQSGDAYSSACYFKLDKGDYVVKLQVRHEKKEVLEKVNEAVLQASFKLASAINLDTYKSFNNAIIANNKKITTLPMAGGVLKSIYIAPLPTEKITKNAVAQSSWFEGQIILAKDELGKKVDTNTFQYIITEGPVVKKANGGAPKENKSKMDEYKEGLRDYQCQMIAKLEGDDAENLYRDVLEDNPNYAGAHLAMIQSVETPSGNDVKNQLPYAFMKQLKDVSVDVEDLRSKLQKTLKLVDLVIDGINQETLLAFYGLKSDNRPDATKIKQQMDKQKQQLLEAYVKKAVIIGKLSLLVSAADTQSADELDNLSVEMTKFVDFNDAKVNSAITV